MSSTQAFDPSSAPWVPVHEVFTHDGSSLTPDYVFFCAPNPAIGRIVSAESTVNRLHPPLAKWVTLAAPFGALTLTIVGCAIAAQVTMDEPLAWAKGCIPGVLFGILAMLIMTIVVVPKSIRRCSFVGERGIATYEYLGRRNSWPSEKLMLFESCHEVFTSQVDSFLNHIYVSTAYRYTWKNDCGEVIHRLEGDFIKKTEGGPPAGDRFWYADAAERQWNSWAENRLAEQMNVKGNLAFSVREQDSLTIGRGYVEVTVNGETNHLTPAEIKAIGVVEGRFVIRTLEARWFRNIGTHEFLCESIGNLKLMLGALQEIGGFRNATEK